MDTVLSKQQILSAEQNEDLLRENPSRWVIMPIQYHDIWNTFKRLEESFWTPDDVIYTNDSPMIAKLPVEVQQMLVDASAFNVISYRKVYDSEGTTLELFCAIQSPEARAFYGFQVAFESFHIEVYNLIFEATVNATMSYGEEADHICQTTYSKSSVIGKKRWVQKYIAGNNPFVEKILAVAAMKHIFNSANFLIRCWLESEKIILPGWTEGLTLVCKDLHIHNEMCSLIYNSMKNRLSVEDVTTLIRDSIKCETQFLKEFIPFDAMGIKESTIEEYVQWVADELLVDMKLPKLFNFPTRPINFVNLEQDKLPKDESKESTRRCTAKEQLTALETGRSAVKESLESEQARKLHFNLEEDF